MGDFVGHPFRGNQWTTAGGVSVSRGDYLREGESPYGTDYSSAVKNIAARALSAAASADENSPAGWTALGTRIPRDTIQALTVDVSGGLTAETGGFPGLRYYMSPKNFDAAMEHAVSTGVITTKERDAFYDAQLSHLRDKVSRDSRYYDALRVRFADAWKQSSTSDLSVTLKEAVSQEFGVTGLRFEGTTRYTKWAVPSRTEINAARALVYRMYRETQEDPHLRELGKSIVLYRGTKDKTAESGTLESWTTDKEVARKFGKHIQTRRVPIKNILTWWGSPTWRTKMDRDPKVPHFGGLANPGITEQEFIVMAGR